MSEAVQFVGVIGAAFFPQFAPAILLASGVISGVVSADEQRRARNRAIDAAKRDLQTMVRSSEEPHRVVYGLGRVSGPIALAHGTGGDAGQLYIVVCFTGHEVQSVEEIIFNETGIGVTNGPTLPGSGFFGTDLKQYSRDFLVPGDQRIDLAPFLTGTLASVVNVWQYVITGSTATAAPQTWSLAGNIITVGTAPGATVNVGWREWTGGPLTVVKSYTGTTTQTADPTLMAQTGGIWTSAHRLLGRSYVMVQLQWDAQRFTFGAPNVSARVKGRIIFDPRDSGTRWSSNPALCIRDYLTNAQFGMNTQTAEIDDASFIAAANTCDEYITVDLATISDLTEREHWADQLDEGVRAGTWEAVAGADATTRLLIHFDGTGTAFTDDAGHSITNVSNTVTKDAARLQFGSASGFFNGNGFWLSVNDSADLNLGNSDFCMEGWIYWRGSLGGAPGGAAASGIIGKNVGGLTANEWLFWVGAGGTLNFGATTNGGPSVWDLVQITSATGVITSDEWMHVAVSRSGDTFYLWRKGALVGTGTASSAGGSVVNGANSISIGVTNTSGTFGWFGNIDEVRISIGAPIYTVPFTPPTAPFAITVATVYRQRRYTCNGVFAVDQRPVDILSKLLSSCAGMLSYTGGQYRIVVGAYQTPTLTLTEDDLRGPIQILPRKAYRDLFNEVRGLFRGPQNFDQLTDFPPYTNATYQTQDGERIDTDIELAFTNDSVMAQRIAKIHLEKERQGIVVNMPCKLIAMALRPGDTVMLTLPRFGWSAKVFRVERWAFRTDDDFGVDLVLQEEAAANYTWDIGSAVVLDPSPDTALTNLTQQYVPSAFFEDDESESYLELMQ